MIIGRNTETSKDVNIDLVKLISTRLLIQANSGGGKSWLIRRLLEQTHGKVQQLVIDLEGEFSTLREEYDYLLVGKDGEIPANIQTAELLAHKLLKLNVSTIIDLSELKHHERITFVKRFLDSLVNAPRDLWHTCLVIVDEAHQFCAEGAKSESASSVIDLQTRGRKRGFCGILATQRIAKLHKDAAAECNNVMVGRTVIDIDRKRASNDLGFTKKEQELSLKKLDDGEFFCYGPAISKDDYIKVKVGDVKTTHPEPGKNIIKASKTPDNIKKLMKDVIDLPKEAETELKTKKEFQNKIMELKRELRTAKYSQPKPVADERSLERARQQGSIETQRKYENQLKVMENNCKKLEKKFIDIGNILDKEIVFSKPEQIIRKIVPETRTKVTKVTEVTPKSNQSVTNQLLVSNGEYNLNLCERKLYSLLYQYSERSFTKPQIGVFTGYSHKSGGFNNSISRLRQLGLIEGSGSNLKVKEINPELAQEFDFSKEKIISKLNKCEGEIYEVLLQNPYESFGKEELAEATKTQYSFNSGGFNNALSRLNTLGLTQRTDGMIKLNPELLEIE
jgi:hypothetical protein